MSQREKTIASLRGLVAACMPPSGRMVWTTDELVQLIVTVVDKTAEGVKELELEQASRVPSESSATLFSAHQTCSTCGHSQHQHQALGGMYWTACTSPECACEGFTIAKHFGVGVPSESLAENPVAWAVISADNSIIATYDGDERSLAEADAERYVGSVMRPLYLRQSGAEVLAAVREALTKLAHDLETSAYAGIGTPSEDVLAWMEEAYPALSSESPAVPSEDTHEQ